MRAEVSADDVSLTCDHATPVVCYLGHSLLEARRVTPDGVCSSTQHIDPGETAGLVLSLRNYGLATASARVTVSTSDPYITIHKGSAELGSIPTGAVVDNQHAPFVVTAASPAPLGRMANIAVSVDHKGATTVSHFRLCIGPRHFLVWDPTPDASSGPVIYRTLRSLGYSGRYATALSAQALAECQVLWGSLGVYPLNRRVPAGGDEAQAISAFLAQGGGAYLEGGDVWFHDPPLGGESFGPLFGLGAYADGSGSMYQVVGEPGTFTAGMLMSHLGETTSIDRLAPAGATSFRLMRNNAPSYYVMIAHNTETYRTIGSSIEFASLSDAAYPSTKAELARQFMFFFLLRDPQQIEPAPPPDAPPGLSGGARARVLLAPNPCDAGTLLRCRVKGAGLSRLDLYDAGGRHLRTLLEGPLAPGLHQLRLDTAGLAAGCYFVGAPDGPPATGTRLLIVR